MSRPLRQEFFLAHDVSHLLWQLSHLADQECASPERQHCDFAIGIGYLCFGSGSNCRELEVEGSKLTLKMSGMQRGPVNSSPGQELKVIPRSTRSADRACVEQGQRFARWNPVPDDCHGGGHLSVRWVSRWLPRMRHEVRPERSTHQPARTRGVGLACTQEIARASVTSRPT